MTKKEKAAQEKAAKIAAEKAAQEKAAPKTNGRKQSAPELTPAQKKAAQKAAREAAKLQQGKPEPGPVTIPISQAAQTEPVLTPRQIAIKKHEQNTIAKLMLSADARLKNAILKLTAALAALTEFQAPNVSIDEKFFIAERCWGDSYEGTESLVDLCDLVNRIGALMNGEEISNKRKASVA